MIVALGSSGVDLHIGSYTSCRLLENGLTLNIDVSNTLMYTPGEVLPIVCNITKQRMDSRVRIPQSKYDAVLEHFYGLKINYAFPGGQKRGCRVYGLSKHSISEIEFELDGKPVSVKSYFENKYGCEFLYPNLQCFNSSNKAGRDSWMPIEFSTICAKQIYRKALEAEQVRKMIDITCQAPSLRMDKIRSAYERFKSPKRLYDEFSIVPTGQFMTVEARKLPDESLKFGKDSRTPIVTPVNGAWNLHNKVLMRRNTIAIWDVVVYQAQNSLRDNDLSKFLDTLRGALSDVGIDSLPPGRVHRLPDPCRDLGSTI